METKSSAIISIIISTIEKGLSLIMGRPKCYWANYEDQTTHWGPLPPSRKPHTCPLTNVHKAHDRKMVTYMSVFSQPPSFFFFLFNVTMIFRPIIQ